MRVLFSSRPAYGHLYPLMPLADAFRRLGHEVTFATGEDFVPKLQALGFEAMASGASILWAEEEAIRRDPALGSLEQHEKEQLGAAMFSRLLPERTVEDLPSILASTGAEIVVYEQADLGVPLAAAIVGIPSVIHSYGIPWPQFMIDLMAPNLHELWREHGIDPPDDPISGDAYIDISPATIGDGSGLGLDHWLPLRPVPFAEPIGEIPQWVNGPRRRPLVYVTLGTVVYERVDVLRAVIDGLAGLDVDVLVSVGPRGSVDALGPLPPGVTAQPFFPQDRLMPHVDAVVHHCGSGTMLGGLGHGVPQLALPQGADQFFNAARIAEVGAGLAMMPNEIDPQSVADRVGLLLNDASYRRAAKGIRAEIASMPSPEEVAARLVETAGELR